MADKGAVAFWLLDGYFKPFPKKKFVQLFLYYQDKEENRLNYSNKGIKTFKKKYKEINKPIIEE